MAAIETTPEAPEAAENLADRVRQALARLTNQQKILLMVAIAALIALAVGASTWLKQSDYRILFSNISERDGGSIIAALEQMNVPYRFNEGGSAILIPGTRVHEVRLRLATQGLPKGGGVGFELMENQKFGISQFAEQVNYQRGLEGELARTIQSIGAVQGARVHLAIPKPTVFLREELKPSASVMVSLYPGRSLDPMQIVGIQNLVAASVPNLAVAGVTVIDQSGAMISQLKSRLMEAGLDPTQIKYVQEIEANTIKRVEDILLPILGKGNARVQIAADIDFSQSEQTAETHRPNTTPPDVSIRSQQTSETASTSPSALGVPGALSNQPPVPPTAPITQPDVPGATPGAPGQANQPPIPGQINAAGVQAPITNVGQPINTRKDSTINYEVDKTIRHTRQSIGVIKRLSAAVVINHRKDAKGVMKPLAEAEIKQIDSLVKEAMGFSKERGDTVSVANAAFTPVERSEVEIPLWKDPENIDLLRELLKYAAIALIAAYLIFKVIRPLLQTMLPPPPPPPAPLEVAKGQHIDTVDEEGGAGESPMSESQLLDMRIEEVRAMAQQDPMAVANIIKEWIGANGS